MVLATKSKRLYPETDLKVQKEFKESLKNILRESYKYSIII